MKNNIKTIMIVVITAIICISGTVYAVSEYYAKDISFTPSTENQEKGFTATNVEEALNKLYEIQNNNENQNNKIIIESGIISKNSAGTFFSENINISKGTKKVYIYSSINSTYGVNFNVSSPLIKNDDTILYKSNTIRSVVANGIYKSEIELTGEEGTITINYLCNGSGKHFGSSLIIFQ